jgi:probable H4MPT-linked C1 transfer pathway protein
MLDVLGLDIGGANLKAAHTRSMGRLVPFALWKNPHGLTAALRDLIADMPPFDLLAVTMTGELCDCFTSKKEGVEAILDSVEQVAGRAQVLVWTTHGQFLPPKEARQETLRVAAANWLAAATLGGKYADKGAALFLDIGSTTTDIVELCNGKPVPSAWTDMERLKLGELVYTGVRRTPVCALLGPKVCAELFATTLDVYLVLGLLPEDEKDCNTADGRPATKSWAHLRLARMLGGDGDSVSEHATTELALEVMNRQKEIIGAALKKVRERMPDQPQMIVMGGSGEFLARLISWPKEVRLVSLEHQLGSHLSETICAYALVLLANQ